MMRNIQSVSVMYHGRKVGTLSMGSRSVCQFEYDKNWLADGFSISPLKLPLKAGLFTADYMPFNGNFGIFEDSLPGGYGEYLLRKILNKSGIDSKSLTPVQWLSIVGSSGMGALCYVPETKLQQEETRLTLDEMQKTALDVLSEETDLHADELYFRSGNSGGVRPKCLYTDAEGHWLVKFRHTYDPKNMGEIEFHYNEMARRCGIDVPDFKLVDGKYFATRRFDIERLRVGDGTSGMDMFYTVRGQIKQFVRFYNYLAQVERTYNRDLYRTYVFCDLLLKLIKTKPHERIDLNKQLMLVNSRIEAGETQSIHLDKNAGGLSAQKPGAGNGPDDKRDLLSNIIDKVNMMFRGNFTKEDRLLFLRVTTTTPLRLLLFSMASDLCINRSNLCVNWLNYCINRGSSVLVHQAIKRGYVSSG